MILNNKAYDVLKWVAQYLLPASGTLYFALATIWGLPYGEQVIGTITAIDIFLGVILGISTNQYKKSDVATDGQLLVDVSDPNKDIYRLNINSLDGLADKKLITLSIETVSNLASKN